MNGKLNMIIDHPQLYTVHCVSKNDTDVAHYKCVIYEGILIIFFYTTPTNFTLIDWLIDSLLQVFSNEIFVHTGLGLAV